MARRVASAERRSKSTASTSRRRRRRASRRCRCRRSLRSCASARWRCRRRSTGSHSLQDEALEFRLQAVAFVSHGAFLHKFRKSGREKLHRRFVKVTGEGLCILHWEKKSAAAVRADAEVYESCFQGADLLDEGTCFQVILEKRMLFFQAESPRGAPALGVGRQRHRHGRGGHPRRGGARRHRPHRRGGSRCRTSRRAARTTTTP